MALNDFNMAI